MVSFLRNRRLKLDANHARTRHQIVPVVTNDLAANAELVRLANEVSAKLTTENVTAMNKQFDVDKEDAATIAKDFLSKNGLS